jgi:hypothetical protein
MASLCRSIAPKSGGFNAAAGTIALHVISFILQTVVNLHRHAFVLSLTADPHSREAFF